MSEYEPEKIEEKWQKKWQEEKIYQPDIEKAEKPFYNLMMFPYPSAAGLHVGNMYAFTGADIFGRFKRMQGYDVFEPIGLDGFGIHSENYALKVDEHPKELAERTEENFYRQLGSTGNGFSWDNRLETYDPDYYKWTQWLFTVLYENGLVERKKARVNWCPSCKTVLSDEQVIKGSCERCESEVEQKNLSQWFFKITDYADKLLENLERIDWSERVKTMQRNWIGRSEGARIEFEAVSSGAEIPVFTTRPDTVYGTTFLALAPEHPLVGKLVKEEQEAAVSSYTEQASVKSVRERTSPDKEKTGVRTGARALNPFNGEKIPIFVADFVVTEYGTGAVMGVPAHDERDFEFARKYGLPVRKVVEPVPLSSFPENLMDEASGAQTDVRVEGECFTGEGEIVNSGPFNGLSSFEAREEMTGFAEEEGFGEPEVHYKLRDWCISRQRYWGPPIPMVNCEKCGWVPLPKEDLPLELPYLEDYQPKGEEESPLAQLEDWVETECPECGGPAERETDVSDNFLDSAWYFFRYPSLNLEDAGEVAFDEEATEKWLPVDMYIGGAEHAVLHLMYTRFLTMVLADLHYIDFEEPFDKFYAHGLLTKEGAKISKSKGNTIVPDDYIKKFGADTLRTYLVFLGPFDQGGDFSDSGILGTHRFLLEVRRLTLESVESESESDPSLVRKLHRTIKKVEEDIGGLKYNTALAAMMEFKNEWSDQPRGLKKEEIKKFLKILAPFAPHLTEELWSKVGGDFSIHRKEWPSYDPALVRKREFTLVVQVDGRVREKFKMEKGVSKQKAEEEALSKENVKKHLEGKKIKKVVFVPDRIINFATGE